MMHNLKAKLSSRRFWTAIGGCLTAILVALNIDQLTVEQVAAIIAAIGTLMVYICGESAVDAERAAGEAAQAVKEESEAKE